MRRWRRWLLTLVWSIFFVWLGVLVIQHIRYKGRENYFAPYLPNGVTLASPVAFPPKKLWNVPVNNGVSEKVADFLLMGMRSGPRVELPIPWNGPTGAAPAYGTLNRTLDETLLALGARSEDGKLLDDDGREIYIFVPPTIRVLCWHERPDLEAKYTVIEIRPYVPTMR